MANVHSNLVSLLYVFQMDEVYSAGVTVASALQKYLHGSETFWLWVTYLGDPACVFLVYFPLTYAYRRRLGVTVLWLALVSEWLNLVFKWFLFGERPFWWIHESGRHSDVDLKQFSSTCETGPGSPSGHCMITGAALWPVVMFLSEQLSQRGIQRFIPIFLYFLLMMGIAVSRVLILAHFPHQVVAGIITGVFLGNVLQRTVPQSRTFVFFALTSIFLLFGAIFMNWGMNKSGLDLSWSIHLATKWCSRPEWIHPETRPFSSVTRSAGNALGLGLALHSPWYQSLHGDNTRSIASDILCTELSTPLPVPIGSPDPVSSYQKDAVPWRHPQEKLRSHNRTTVCIIQPEAHIHKQPIDTFTFYSYVANTGKNSECCDDNKRQDITKPKCKHPQEKLHCDTSPMTVCILTILAAASLKRSKV
uniref:glucose-6-phosphatase n=1 Tax=Leptobrachium leishanense TaxID=445787 RepID=A0A8C5QWL7_9ANUR